MMSRSPSLVPRTVVALTAALAVVAIAAGCGRSETAEAKAPNEPEATEVAERVLARLEAPIDVGEPVTVGASIGIAFNSNMNETVEELIRDADQAMYRAKAQGKNRYVISNHKMDVPTPELLGRWKRMMQLKWYSALIIEIFLA